MTTPPTIERCPIDPRTRSLLEYHHLAAKDALKHRPPDWTTHDRHLRLIDDILDHRPRPVGIASDGEVIFEHSSPWVQAQLDARPNDLVPSVAPIAPAEPPAAGGGVAVAEPPATKAEGPIRSDMRTADQMEQDAINRAKRYLHGQ